MHSVDTCYSLLKSYEREARRLQDIVAQHQDPTQHEQLPGADTQKGQVSRSPQNGDVLAQHHTSREQPPTTQIRMETDSLQQPIPPMGPAPVQRPIIRIEWHPG